MRKAIFLDRDGAIGAVVPIDEKLAAKHGIEPSQSFAIGDRWRDVDAGAEWILSDSSAIQASK